MLQLKEHDSCPPPKILLALRKQDLLEVHDGPEDRKRPRNKRYILAAAGMFPDVF
jgi:hypothetical protein